MTLAFGGQYSIQLSYGRVEAFSHAPAGLAKPAFFQAVAAPGAR